MQTRAILTIALAAISLGATGQTNIQVLYDFGKDRGHVTTTLEGLYNDRWGNTFLFIDHDFNSRDEGDKVYAPSGTYMEIARCLNFWGGTALAPLSLQVEYDGGVYNGYTINNAFLVGLDWFVHSPDFNDTFNFKVLYKHIQKTGQKLPLQLTFVWGLKDLFNVTGLTFSGFADFWWEDHSVYGFVDDKASGYRDFTAGELSEAVFLSEPQLWYDIGRHIGCDNLNVGGEVELSYDFGTGKGFFVRPCAGVKWVF